MVLKHMRTHEKVKQTTAREICDLYKAPFDTISKVMQTMSKHQILISHQGASGGYTLGQDLGNISYSRLVEIVEGRSKAKDCIELNCSLFSSCNIISPVRNLNQRLSDFISSISLAELLEDSIKGNQTS